jgi:DNA-binding transcriptional ArsR family regulator
MTGSASSDADPVRARFGRIWPAHLAGFTRLLVRLRAHFDGDLDLALVLAVVGERTRPDSWQARLESADRLSVGHVSRGRQRPINTESIADYSGIPRETVRRKLLALRDRGWIDRDERGYWYVTGRAAGDLEQATADSLDYLRAILDAARGAE